MREGDERSDRGCLSDERAAALVEGNLSGEDRTSAERHLAACETCRRVVSELVALDEARVTAVTVPDGPVVCVVADGTPSPGDVLGRRYVIQRQVGAGGMGIVYAAYDPELDRRVAIKILRPDVVESVAGAQERLRVEARAMAKLQHPSVVQVYDVGVDGGRVYIAMEYIDGEDLGRFAARQRKRGDWRSILAACVDAARGIAAAHAAGLVHRDLKPSNVLRARDGRVVVVDFGLTRKFSAAELDPAASLSMALSSEVSIAAGTPAYVAPEQAAGLASDARSDQYSFCVMMRECLLGIRPAAVRGEHERPPKTRVPASIRAALVRGVSRDAEARHPSMTALIEALVAGARQSRRARMRLALAAAVATGAIATAVVVRSETAAPALADAEAAPIGVLVQDLGNAGSPYGSRDNRGGAIAEVLAIVLRDYRALAPTGPQPVLDAEWRAFGEVSHQGSGDAAQRVARTEQLWTQAARRLGARYRITGTFAERVDTISIEVRLVDVATGQVTHTIARSRPLGESAQLVREVADDIAHTLRPGARADTSLAGEIRARELMERGAAYVTQRQWLIAQPYFEQAVEVAPDLFDAWRAVVPIYAWTLAPEPVLVHAVERAAALAPDPDSRQLWDGAGAYLRGDLAHAIATLSALETAGALRGDRSELDYYLGEALFHDGRYTDGVQRLARVLEAPDAKQRAGVEIAVWPVAVHLGEYALARGDLAAATQYLLLQKQSLGAVRFARGEYEALAASDDPPFSGYAALVLGRPPGASDERLLRLEPGFAIAQAAGAGDRAAARRELAWWWATARAQPPSVHASYETALVLEIALAAGLADDVRPMLAIARERARGAMALATLQRAEILAAAELGTPTAFARTGMPTRTARLATAVETALAGDRARAAVLLGELVDDPGPAWDYPERVALVRWLSALGRDRDVRTRCAAIERPAVFRLAWLPAREMCRRLTTRR
ncbi:MAG TPA: serine/threonine-protein kinase [Kofleriaceae bacterium]|nr:serine/threonine-protein kinase [Kofleriaceae bacterium]